MEAEPSTSGNGNPSEVTVEEVDHNDYDDSLSFYGIADTLDLDEFDALYSKCTEKSVVSQKNRINPFSTISRYSRLRFERIR